MMDKVINENNISIPGSILKRNELRLEKIAKKKEESDSCGPHQLDIFNEEFKQKQKEIELALKSAPSLADKKKLPELFQKISHDIQLLNKHTFASSMFLKAYDLRMCKETIQGLQEAAQELEERLIPKKKFGFSRKISVQPKPKSTTDTVDFQKTFVIENDCGYQDRCNEHLILPKEDIFNRDVVLSRLKGCTVLLKGIPNTIHMNSISDCTIVSGPVTTSVMVEDCCDSKLIFACQQIRIHTTHRTDFYLHITTKAIIEDSNFVRFAPYNYRYKELEEDFIMANLDPSKNNWDQVDDFNWLASSPSPHWSLLPEEERIVEWQF